MPTFKGIKVKDTKNVAKKDSTTQILESPPPKPYLPPYLPHLPYLHRKYNDINEPLIPQYSITEEKHSGLVNKTLPKTITLNSGKNNDVMKITTYIDIIFDK